MKINKNLAKRKHKDIVKDSKNIQQFKVEEHYLNCRPKIIVIFQERKS